MPSLKTAEDIVALVTRKHPPLQGEPYWVDADELRIFHDAGAETIKNGQEQCGRADSGSFITEVRYRGTRFFHAASQPVLL
jgi:hypothetical protein